MTTTVHKNLTGSDLHEPKGADTATSGKVYVSDGAGSGVWTDASTIITNTAFTTGDLKITHKVTADTGWILWSNGTIGDGSSSATIRANADCATLFALYWDNYSNTLCPIYTSAGVVSTRGASAAADFAAHKRLGVPVGASRVLALASGSGAQAVGQYAGSDTVTISQGNLPNVNLSAASLAVSFYYTAPLDGVGGSSGNFVTSITPNQPGSYAQVTPTITGNVPLGGSGTALSVVQNTAYINVMIKL